MGVSMMVAGLTAPLMVLLAPFFGVSGPNLTEFAATMALIGEVMFWGGVAVAGRPTWRLIRSQGWRQTPKLMLLVMLRGEQALPRRSNGPVPTFVSIAPPPPLQERVRLLSVPPPRAASKATASS